MEIIWAPLLGIIVGTSILPNTIHILAWRVQLIMNQTVLWHLMLLMWTDARVLHLASFQQGINTAWGPMLATCYVSAWLLQFHRELWEGSDEGLPFLSSWWNLAPVPSLPCLAPQSFTLSRCSVNTCWVVDTGLHVNPSSSKARTRPIKKKTNSSSF